MLVEEPGGARYVLRCCTRNPCQDRILFQLDFQDHLRRRGIPTAEVVTTRTGERCVASDAGFQWILFRFVEGHAYDYGSRAQLRSAARCLSGIHAAAADFTATPVPDDTIPDLRRWWTHGDEELTSLHALFADSDVEPELDFLGRWRDALVRALPLGRVDELPGAWLHADFHGQNLVFSDGQVRGVFDFDVVHHGWRLADIGYAMFCFSREDRASSLIRADAARAFLETFALTELERTALPYFVVATQARTAPGIACGSGPAPTLPRSCARTWPGCALSARASGSCPDPRQVRRPRRPRPRPGRRRRTWSPAGSGRSGGAARAGRWRASGRRWRRWGARARCRIR